MMMRSKCVRVETPNLTQGPLKFQISSLRDLTDLQAEVNPCCSIYDYLLRGNSLNSARCVTSVYK